MAAETTSITASVIPIQYAGLPSGVRDHTSVPFRELRYQALQTIAAPAAGDTQLVDIVCNTVPGNAYSLLEARVMMFATSTAANWDDNAFALFRSAPTSPEEYYYQQLHSVGAFRGFSLAANMKIWELEHVTGAILRPDIGQAVSLFIELVNDTADDVAYSLSFAARMLEYSIPQSFIAAANSPIPIRGS